MGRAGVLTTAILSEIAPVLRLLTSDFAASFNEAFEAVAGFFLRFAIGFAAGFAATFALGAAAFGAAFAAGTAQTGVVEEVLLTVTEVLSFSDLAASAAFLSLDRVCIDLNHLLTAIGQETLTDNLVTFAKIPSFKRASKQRFVCSEKI